MLNFMDFIFLACKGNNFCDGLIGNWPLRNFNPCAGSCAPWERHISVLSSPSERTLPICQDHKRTCFPLDDKSF